MGEDNENNHKRKNKNSNEGNKNNALNKATACTDEQLSKKRKRKEIAIFGNYRNYYGYRVIPVSLSVRFTVIDCAVVFFLLSLFVLFKCKFL